MPKIRLDLSSASADSFPLSEARQVIERLEREVAHSALKEKRLQGRLRYPCVGS